MACIIPGWPDWLPGDCDARFNTFAFLLVFLPVVVATFWAMRSNRSRLAWLAGASLLFYSFWDIRFVPLLVFGALLDYGVALAMSRPGARRKRWLLVSIFVNLGVLAVFKYAGFATRSAQGLLDLFGAGVSLPYPEIVLPVGISFYTFQTLGYTIDVYRRQLEPERDPIKYIAYVTMFPQLVAGPIVRYKEVDEQLGRFRRRPNPGLFAAGIGLFSVGLWKKSVIADTAGRIVDPLWAAHHNLSSFEAWVAAIGFRTQIYFDFSGYSDMALGIGAMLGYRLPINFNAPYQARDPADFWRRWHMTLGRFIRDYLFFPLGGTRGSAWRVAGVLFAVFAIAGLWHGADWTFVLWGALHGSFIVLHRLTRKYWTATPPWITRTFTSFVILCIALTFRATDLGQAGNMFAAMLWHTDGLGDIRIARPVLTAAFVWGAFLSLQWGRPACTWNWRPSVRTALFAAALLTVSLIAMSIDHQPFVYYDF